jgi:hypothetical protein
VFISILVRISASAEAAAHSGKGIPAGVGKINRGTGSQVLYRLFEVKRTHRAPHLHDAGDYILLDAARANLATAPSKIYGAQTLAPRFSLKFICEVDVQTPDSIGRLTLSLSLHRGHTERALNYLFGPIVHKRLIRLMKDLTAIATMFQNVSKRLKITRVETLWRRV